MDRDRYEVELDGDLLEVLSSETRRKILHVLDDRRRTLSELARDLDLNKSTIHEHLGRLTEADLVDRDEDDRKWTYYDLTREGERILNPNPERTWVRLVIVAAVAGLAAGLLVVGGLATVGGLVPDPWSGGQASEDEAPGPGSARSSTDGAAPATLTVDLARSEALARSGTTIRGDVSGLPDGGGPLEAYLIPEHQAGSLEPDLQGTSGYAVDARRDGSNLTVELPGGVPVGTYRLYVASGGARPDVDDLPRVVLRESLVDLSNETFWKGFSDRIRIDRVGIHPAPDATLLLERPGAEARSSLTVDIDNGTARLGPDALEDLPEGSYRIHALASGEEPVPLGATLDVRTPRVAVEPQVVREDRPVDLQVHVQAGAASEGIPVAVNGSGRDTHVVDRSTRTLRVHPDAPGTLPLRVGRNAHRNLTVLPEVRASLSVVDGPAWEIGVDDEDGDPVAGVAVFVDDTYRNATNRSGEARIAVPDDGIHALELAPPGGQPVGVPVRAEGWNATVLGPSVDLSARAESPGPRRLSVAVDAANARPVDVDGTVVARVDGDVADADAVSVPANDTTSQVLVAADVEAGSQVVTVEATAPASPQLTVRNRTTTDGATDGGGTNFTSTGSTDDTADETADNGTGSGVQALGDVHAVVEVAGEELPDADQTLSKAPEPLRGEGADEGSALEEPAGAPSGVPRPALLTRVLLVAAAALAWGARARRR